MRHIGLHPLIKPTKLHQLLFNCPYCKSLWSVNNIIACVVIIKACKNLRPLLHLASLHSHRITSLNLAPPSSNCDMHQLSYFSSSCTVIWIYCMPMKISTCTTRTWQIFFLLRVGLRVKRHAKVKIRWRYKLRTDMRFSESVLRLLTRRKR